MPSHCNKGADGHAAFASGTEAGVDGSIGGKVQSDGVQLLADAFPAARGVRLLQGQDHVFLRVPGSSGGDCRTVLPAHLVTGAGIHRVLMEVSCASTAIEKDLTRAAA